MTSNYEKQFIRNEIHRTFSINNLSNDMKRFLEYTYQVVQKSLERYLYQIQKKESLKQEEEKAQEMKRKQFQDELTGAPKLRSILRDYRNNPKRLGMINGNGTTMKFRFLYSKMLFFLNV